MSGSNALKSGLNTRLVIACLALLAASVGCKHEEKKTATPGLEPPKLRSAAERGATAAHAQTMDRRPTLGMKMSEVETLQGKPDRVDVMNYPGTGESLEEWRWSSIENGCRTVVFTNKRATLLRECVGTGNTTGSRSPGGSSP